MVDTEEEEGLEVVVADTVAKPGAVVIHFGNADLADRTVVCSLGLPVATVDTVVLLVRWRHLRDDFGSFE